MLQSISVIMFLTDRHPDDDTLRLFAVGRLAEERGDEIESHLADCDFCTNRLDIIERKKHDPLLREMQAARAVEPSCDFTAGRLLGGHFRLECRIGRGGMGEAWKAYDETAGRHVVLKFVPKGIQNVADAMKAVLESFQKVHALQHSHICPLYLLDNDPEHGFFLVMKYIDGMSLDVHRRRNEPMSFEAIMRILRDVASALDYSHDKKVVHRDVKPANIMIGSTDGVQLIDFGLADEIRATRTGDVSVSKISGTRSYMAPEQWRGGKQDARTDQYALAVTAYELLSGNVPFSGADTEALKNAVLYDPPAPIPSLPEHVNAALLRGLAKNRNERFESCRAFVEAIAKPEYRLNASLRKSVPWEWIAQGIIATILIASMTGWYFNHRPAKPAVDADPQPSVATEAPGVETLVESVTGFSIPAKSMMTPLIRPQREGVARMPVIRVTIKIDAHAKGKIVVNREFSTLALDSFRGVRFKSRSFQKAQFFRGKDDEDGLSRITFADGDMSTHVVGPSPFGWELWRSGCFYNRRQGSVRYCLHDADGRAGLSIGKAATLPCTITYEVADNDDRLPYLEMTLYRDLAEDDVVATISCWGHKEDDGRLRLGTAFTHPATRKDRVLVIDDAVVEKQKSFSHEFQLPLEIVADHSKRVKRIKCELTVDESGKTTPADGFDLTLLDMIGRFKGDAGFSVEERGGVPMIGRADPHGPAWQLLPDAEIVSINGETGSAAELRKVLDLLHFSDDVTVRFVPKGGGESITCLFNAE